jgi:hypothetical protein
LRYQLARACLVASHNPLNFSLPFSIIQNIDLLTARYVEKDGSEIHLNPFHSVSCGHAFKLLHSLVTLSSEQTCFQKLYIWTNDLFSVNHALEIAASTMPNVKLLNLPDHSSNISLLSRAYLADSFFSANNLSISFPSLRDFSKFQKIYAPAAIAMAKPLLTSKDALNLATQNLINSNKKIVTIHVRTPDYKGSHTAFEATRDVNVRSYLPLLEVLKSNGYSPVFLAGTSFPYDLPANLHVATNHAEAIQQYELISRCEFMICCSSGISTLWSFGTLNQLKLNTTSFMPDDLHPPNHLFGMKNISIRKFSRLTPSIFFEFILLDWTCNEFRALFNVTSLNEHVV